MGEIRAPITGNVWQILAKAGNPVHDGQIVAIIESMKLEIPVEAEIEGVVTEVRFAVGDAVAEDDVMFVVE